MVWTLLEGSHKTVATPVCLCVCWGIRNVNSLIGSQAASLQIPAPPPPHCVTLDDEPSGPTSSSRKAGNRLTHGGVVTVKQDSTFSKEDFRKSLAQSNYSNIISTQR